MAKKQKSVDNCIFAAPVAFAKGAGEELRPFQGIAYGGGVIENHWYWDRVAFDLDTLTVPNPLAALIDHDGSMRAGVIRESTVDAKGLSVSGTLLRSEHGLTVARDSDDGFPWQMSVRIDPDRIDFIDEKTTAMVNGRQVQGPLNIFRDSTLLEISFCATGWDRTTSAVAMSRQVTAEDVSTSQGTSMTEQEMQAKIDAANRERDAAQAEVTRVSAEATAFAKTKRTNEVTELLTAVNGAAPAAADIEPYLAMPEASFSAVAAQMRKTVKAPTPNAGLPAALFASTATTGATGTTTNATEGPAARKAALEADAKKRLASYNRSVGRAADHTVI